MYPNPNPAPTPTPNSLTLSIHREFTLIDTREFIYISHWLTMSVFVIGYSEQPLRFSSHLIDTASASFIFTSSPWLAESIRTRHTSLPYNGRHTSLVNVSTLVV
jgi:hypothetical protein